MGLKTLLGGKPSQSSSKNVNNDLITGSLGSTMGYANQAGGLMSSLLGGDTTALNNAANSGGMKFLQDQGDKAITSMKASKGLLGSGSYGTALSDYNQGLASTYLNQYMQGLDSLGKLGIGAGQVVSGAGETQKSTGPKQGLLSMAQQAAQTYVSGGGKF